MTSMSDLDGKKCTLIPLSQLQVGHLTAMGVVTEKPVFSPSGKTALVTVETHSGRTFTDRRNARAKIAVWLPEN